MANRTSVIAAELNSPRTRWKAVADSVTIMIPPAAHATSHGRIPRQSRKGKSHGGQDFRDAEEELEPPRQRRVHLFGNRGRGDRKSQPWAKNATASILQEPEHDVHDTLSPSLTHASNG